MKAMATKQPSQDFHRQHQEVILTPLIQNEIPSTDAIVLQRMSACPCDGGCPLCEGDMFIQPKLRIGEPGDRYEREADGMRANTLDYEFHNDNQGEAICNMGGTIPFSVRNDNNSCTRPCTTLHEYTHVYDFLSCCIKARQAVLHAARQGNQPLVAIHIAQWGLYMNMIRPWIEHRAYLVSLYCLNYLRLINGCFLPSELVTTILVILGALAGATIGALIFGPITATGGAVALTPAGPPGWAVGAVAGELMSILGTALIGGLLGYSRGILRNQCCQEIEPRIISTISNLRRYPAGTTQHRCPFP